MDSGSNACRACARSKRKCGRQMPSCARCVERGASCIYPRIRSRATSSSRQLRPNSLRGSVPRVEDEVFAEVAGDPSPRTANLILGDEFMWDTAFPLMDNGITTPSSLIQAPTELATRADWFLEPETWRISHTWDSSVAAPAGKATMKKYVAAVQSWFERWVETNSNPFIHSRLYSANFPACVQVAYTTFASYIHRTPSNTDTILQIVEDRSTKLLLENGAVLDWIGAKEWADGGEQDVNLLAQIARLHALMVYQIIGLFDGDIRARHVAEGRMAVQDSWAGKLLRSAANALSNTHAAVTHLVDCLPTPSTYSQQQWYLWLLSETIRRTWFIAVSFSPVFSALQQRSARCPGGIMYTNRSGLWDAASAGEWEKRCSEKDVAFLHRFEWAGLFNDLQPADIDEFGTAIMDMTYNGDMLEKWRSRSVSL